MKLNYSFVKKVFTLFHFFKEKYLLRPKLKLTFRPRNGSYSKKMWPIYKIENQLFVYELCWKYEIVINNISKYSTNNLKIYFDRPISYHFRLDQPNPTMLVHSYEEIVLKGEYTMLEECKEDRCNIPSGMPPEFKSLNLLLEYQDMKKNKFFTVFDFKLNTNHYFRNKPIGSNWF